jgi:hypothetical protein
MADVPAAYTPGPRPRRETDEQLRARIPGWGVDLDPADRPSYPRLDPREGLTGARWDFPERQPEHRPRERSVEHAFVTPVFGTAQPLHGVSGALRRLSYGRYSEARAAHWLLLMLGDRVDATGAHLRSLLTLHPDDPVTETGIAAETTRHGVASRVGRGRTDVGHQALDPVLVAGPWLVAGGLTWWGLRRLLR